uniref:Uncharacterized protein n=1 Tax=Salix viminalis TaxID=40686 RepID=A0A6N2NC99_SALVM
MQDYELCPTPRVILRHNPGSKYIQGDLMLMVMLICKAKADPVKKKAAARTEEESEQELSSTEMNIKLDKANPYLCIFSVPTN